MSVMDKLKELIGKSPDKFQKGIDKAASAADERTGGKHKDQIDKGADQARNYVDKQDEQGGRPPEQNPGGGPPPQ